MKLAVSHPTGNEFFRAAVAGFNNADILNSVYTSFASFPGTLLYSLGELNIFSDIRRRGLKKEYKKCTHIHPWRELSRLIAVKMHSKILTRHETGILSVDAVYKSFDRYVAKQLGKEKQLNAIYAYEDGAYFTFKKARELKLDRFYDLPIGYWRSLRAMTEEEQELNPGWAATMPGLKDSKEKLNRKDEEISLADKIFVASSFTATTLKNYPGKLSPVQIIPYAFPDAAAKKYRSHNAYGKIKLLFVGGLSQRKGLSYLFKAVEGLNKFIELTIVGRLPQTTFEPLNRELSKHKYISSLSHEKVLKLMREHDVLLFPSLFEGFGQVITEAMAQGTPVITTERTAGPDIINHGENGWLVKAGDAAAIKNILEQIILLPSVIAEVGTGALETAKKRPWEVYGLELAEAVMNINKPSSQLD